jgi:phage terminase small subunit
MSQSILTEKQFNFALNYIRNGNNVSKAALDAGYSKRYANGDASNLLKHKGIKERVNNAYDKLVRKQDHILSITIQDKAKVLTRIIYDIVPKDESIEPKREHYKTAIAAIAELNRMAGDYAPDKRLSVTVDATQDKLNDAKKIYNEY